MKITLKDLWDLAYVSEAFKDLGGLIDAGQFKQGNILLWWCGKGEDLEINLRIEEAGVEK